MGICYFDLIPLLGLIGIIMSKIIKKIAKLSCCKRLLHSHLQNGHNDAEYNPLIIVGHEDPELQECTRNVKEDGDDNSSIYKWVSYY